MMGPRLRRRVLIYQFCRLFLAQFGAALWFGLNLLCLSPMRWP